MSEAPPLVYVVTAAWNQAGLTRACLASVLAQDYPRFEVAVFDNGSRDDTAAMITTEFPTVQLLRSEENLGFSRGFNPLLRLALEAGAGHIFLINNDTILDPRALSALVAEALAEERIGLVTAKIYQQGDEGRLWTVGAWVSRWTLDLSRNPAGEIDEGQWEWPRDIDFAPLCGTLLSAEALRDVGLLDEGYFVYYEDMDFCTRLRRAGWRLRLAPAAIMWHAGAASSGGRDTPLERYWMAQASGRYFRKFAGRWQLLAIVLPFRLASALKTSVRLAFQGNGRALRAYWLGLWRGWTTGRATAVPPVDLVDRR